MHTESAVALRCLSALPVAMRLSGLGLPGGMCMVTDRPSAGLLGDSWCGCDRVTRLCASTSFDDL
jgi:hypothetical protein